MGTIDPDTNEAFKAAYEYLEASMQYEDIPMNERFVEFTIDRNEEIINSIYDHVKEGREFLNKIGNV